MKILVQTYKQKQNSICSSYSTYTSNCFAYILFHNYLLYIGLINSFRYKIMSLPIKELCHIKETIILLNLSIYMISLFYRFESMSSTKQIYNFFTCVCIATISRCRLSINNGIRR